MSNLGEPPKNPLSLRERGRVRALYAASRHGIQVLNGKANPYEKGSASPAGPMQKSVSQCWDGRIGAEIAG